MKKLMSVIFAILTVGLIARLASAAPKPCNKNSFTPPVKNNPTHIWNVEWRNIQGMEGCTDRVTNEANRKETNEATHTGISDTVKAPSSPTNTSNTAK